MPGPGGVGLRPGLKLMSEPFEITCFARWSRIVGTVRLRLTTRPTDLYTQRHPRLRERARAQGAMEIGAAYFLSST
jgi:hypothetical protein